MASKVYLLGAWAAVAATSAGAFTLQSPSAARARPSSATSLLSMVAARSTASPCDAKWGLQGQVAEEPKKRAPVLCGICGQPKKGHICTGPPPMSDVPLQGAARKHHGFDPAFGTRLQQKTKRREGPVLALNDDLPPVPPHKDARDAAKHPAIHMYNAWATDGRDLVMELTHHDAFEEMWEGLTQMHAKFRPDGEGQDSFAVLDGGCGNGWASRIISRHPSCAAVTGIDAAACMIDRARALSEKEVGAIVPHFCVADLETWKPEEEARVDLAILCECLYFCQDPAAAVGNVVSNGLKEGGVLAATIECYQENALTRSWGRTLGVPLHCKSEKEWRDIFEAAGLSRLTLWRASDEKTFLPQKHSLRQGTLLIIGEKDKACAPCTRAPTDLLLSTIATSPPPSKPNDASSKLEGYLRHNDGEEEEEEEEERSSREKSRKEPPPPPRKLAAKWASLERRSCE